MRTIAGKVETMTIRPQDAKTYFKRGWAEVQESFEDAQTEAPAAKKIGRPKKEHNG